MDGQRRTNAGHWWVRWSTYSWSTSYTKLRQQVAHDCQSISKACIVAILRENTKSGWSNEITNKKKLRQMTFTVGQKFVAICISLEDMQFFDIYITCLQVSTTIPKPKIKIHQNPFCRIHHIESAELQNNKIHYRNKMVLGTKSTYTNPPLVENNDKSKFHPFKCSIKVSM